jgi:hypothetical protein
MKPKPLASLNHFTVPVVRILPYSWMVLSAGIRKSVPPTGDYAGI